MLHSIENIYKNTKIVLSGSIIANIFALLSTILISRSLGATEFGYYIILITIVEIISKIFNFQTWQAIIKFGSDHLVGNSFLNLHMLLKACVIIELLSLSIGFFIGQLTGKTILAFLNVPNDYYTLLSILLFSTFFRFSDLTNGIFRLYNDFKTPTLLLAVASILKFIGFLVLWFVKSNLISFVIVNVIVDFIISALKLKNAADLLALNHVETRVVFKEKLTFISLFKSDFSSFIFYNNLDTTTRVISKQFDNLLVSKILGPQSVAIYKIVKDLGNLISKFADPLYQSIFPDFAKLVSLNNEIQLKKILKKITNRLVILAIVLYMIFFFFGSYFIDLFFGKNYSFAYNVTLIYLVGILIAFITLPLYPMQHAYGLAKKSFTNQIFATVCYICLLYFLTVEYGLSGAAWAYIFYYILITILTLKSLKII